jgi:glutaminase
MNAQTICSAGFARMMAALLTVSISFGAQAQDIQDALNTAYTRYKDLKEGKNADYIPALAKVDANIYGIVLVTTS